MILLKKPLRHQDSKKNLNICLKSFNKTTENVSFLTKTCFFFVPLCLGGEKYLFSGKSQMVF